MTAMIEKETGGLAEQPKEESGMTTAEEKRTALPFQQRPRESAKAFAAFTLYLGMGPSRSVTRVAAKLDAYRSVIQGWSQRYHWTTRVAAYHAHMAAIELKATETLVAARSSDWAATHESVRRQAWQEAEDLIVLAREFRARWRDSDRLPDFGALVRALDLAFKLKQFAAGMPSEIKETHTLVTGKVSVEWEAAIRKAYGVVVDVQEAGKTEAGDQRAEAAGSGVPALPEVKP